MLRDGIDLVEHRRAQKLALRINVRNTFGAESEEWYKHNLPSWSKAAAEKARQYLDKDLLPPLRTRPITNLTTEDVRIVIEKIEGRKAFNVAKKARQ